MRLLVTDTTWNIAGLAHALRGEGFYITEAGNAAEALDFAEAGEQDAFLIDPDVPDMAAAALVAQLRAQYPKTVICVVSRRVTEADRAHFLTRGADAMIEWPAKAVEVAAQIRAYVRRAAGFAHPEIAIGPVTIDVARMTVLNGDMPIHLTRLEYELVEMLALRNGTMVTREQLMLQLYAWQDEPDPKIIDVYICRIRAKLAAAGVAQEVIQTSFGQGVRMPVLGRAVLEEVAA
ncbi:winged helix-turn-helix domain-containing protein [Pseudooceanicola sp. CBS1P-1]|nr:MULTISPECIES: response regulator transcription factor [Pseudooceanicola]MBT9384533.1 winged helix-turn-helix domain-containing protein [Pseudooceanicola endophyticus]